MLFLRGYVCVCIIFMRISVNEWVLDCREFMYILTWVFSYVGVCHKSIVAYTGELRISICNLHILHVDYSY
jgi:hypothetical protein